MFLGWMGSEGSGGSYIGHFRVSGIFERTSVCVYIYIYIQIPKGSQDLQHLQVPAEGSRFHKEIRIL